MPKPDFSEKNDRAASGTSEQSSQTKSPKGREPINHYPWITPRFWHGMPSRVWWPLLAKNRFRVAASRLGFMFGVSVFTPVTDLLALAQHLAYGARIRATPLAGPPIFILGHWRSGTTLLHELLCCDERFSSPSTYQCFAPWHFLLTEPLMLRFGNFLLPEKRPMDNMRAGWRLPQEDEFALLNLGVPTVYQRIMFPQHSVPHLQSLCGDYMEEATKKSFTENLTWFLSALSYQSKKPLILKSPPHTGRLRLIRELFPDAKFIHLVRDPVKLFSSTMKLWLSLDSAQSMQNETPIAALESFIFDCLTTMYATFDDQAKGLEECDLVTVRYEELAAKPVDTCERIYGSLGLGDFGSVRQSMVQRALADRDYATNKHEADSELIERIRTNWLSYAQRFGYA